MASVMMANFTPNFTYRLTFVLVCSVCSGDRSFTHDSSTASDQPYCLKMAKNDKILKVLHALQEQIAELNRSIVEITAKASTCEESEPVETDRPVKFPIVKESDLQAFDIILKDPASYQYYVEHFNNMIAQHRSATTLYNRRRSLKEMLFSE